MSTHVHVHVPNPVCFFFYIAQPEIVFKEVEVAIMY